jgi:flagella basal body P-ring formation protein FlgA
MKSTLITLSFACLTLLSATAIGTEIHFQEQVVVSRALVTLADVAVVYCDDETEQKALSSLELFPAPAAGRSRTVRAQEIVENLALRGVRVDQLRFSGKSVLNISGPGVASSPTMLGKPADLTTNNTRRFEQVTRSYLQQQGVDLALHQVEIKPQTQDAIQSLPSNAALHLEGTVTAGQSTTVNIVAQHGNKVSRIPVSVEFAPVEQAVVLLNTKHRGETITASDVRVEPINGDQVRGTAMRTPADVIGKEVTRTILTGRAVTDGDIRSPILVKRNQVVSVYARGANFTVRTVARSTDEGAHGELINVKTLDNQEQYVARVIGAQEVEVIVAPPVVTTEPPQADNVTER